MDNWNTKTISKNRKTLTIGIIAILLFLSMAWFLIEDTTISDTVITLERTGCFGTCPVYYLTIYGNGIVVYWGEAYVNVKRLRVATISQEKVEELVSEFEKADYFSLDDNYTQYTVTDLPTAITSLTVNGKNKKITHYWGDETAPKELSELEFKIDEIVNSGRWICLSDDRANENISAWCR